MIGTASISGDIVAVKNLTMTGTASIDGNIKDVNNLVISGTATIGNGIVANGDVIVYSGAITNYETMTTLVPSGTTMNISTNGYFDGSSGNGGTDLLSGWTYSISAYRVGALVHLKAFIRRTSTIDYTGAQFYGIQVKLSNLRFRPTGNTKGHGVGGWSGIAYAEPVSMDVILSSYDGAPTLTNPGFYLRFTTFDFGGGQGARFTSASRDQLTFVGSITYLAG
jgi:hypothetical protein